MPVNAPPASPPGNIVANGLSAVVELIWDDAALATSYNVYWGTSPGVTPATGSKIAGIRSLYHHRGRTNGTTYYYVITSVNSLGESGASVEVSVTPN